MVFLKRILKRGTKWILKLATSHQPPATSFKLSSFFSLIFPFLFSALLASCGGSDDGGGNGGGGNTPTYDNEYTIDADGGTGGYTAISLPINSIPSTITIPTLTDVTWDIGTARSGSVPVNLSPAPNVTGGNFVIAGDDGTYIAASLLLRFNGVELSGGDMPPTTGVGNVRTYSIPARTIYRNLLINGSFYYDFRSTVTASTSYRVTCKRQHPQL